MAIAGLAALAAVLAGCANNPLTASLGNFGASNANGPQTTGSINDPQLQANAQPGQSVAGAIGAVGVSYGCPRFNVWPEDEHVTIYEEGRIGESMAVVHRGEITKTVRECQVEPGRVTVKYGFSGRVLLGPQGKSGLIKLPFNVFVTDARREKITTQTMAVDVDIPAGATIGYFSAVQSVSFEIPEGSRPGEFQAFVAFDRKAPNAG